MRFRTPHHLSEADSLALQLLDPTLSSHQLGALGEQYAAAWLKQRDWQVLTRNWHTRFGEIDIVMLSPEDVIVFVEVKTRRSLRFGTPQEAITRSKQINLRRAAMLWLSEEGRHVRHTSIRFDALALLVQDEVTVRHIQEAF